MRTTDLLHRMSDEMAMLCQHNTGRFMLHALSPNRNPRLAMRFLPRAHVQFLLY